MTKFEFIGYSKFYFDDEKNPCLFIELHKEDFLCTPIVLTLRNLRKLNVMVLLDLYFSHSKAPYKNVGVKNLSVFKKRVGIKAKEIMLNI